MSNDSAMGFEVRTDDDTLDELLDEIAQRLKQGDVIDIDEYSERHPEYAERLRQVLPGMQALAELGHAESLSDAESRRNSQIPPTDALGDYRIVREIGRGGMGVVYEAEQLSLGRRVALKVLPFAAVLDERQIKRFKIEALAAAQLDHPHIVDVYGIGCERSVHFYAMRFVEGHSLAEMIPNLYLDSPKMPPTAPVSIKPIAQKNPGCEVTCDPEALQRIPAALADTSPLAALSTTGTADTREFFRSAARIGVEIAEALDHAHQQGVVHRDVKPANIIIDARAKAWVTDFGLAHLDTGVTLTMTGDLVGTLRYMSPEQALAKRVVVDHRTDVYALGVTLYELLTLQPAFPQDDRQELLRHIAFEEPLAPRSLNRGIPPELETIVCKAISKNPSQRYETAQELADDLQRFLRDEPIRARRPNSLQRAAKWSRRHRPVVTTAIVMAVLSLGIGAMGLVMNAVLIADQRDLARKGWDAAENATIQAKHQLFEARMSQARAGRRSRQVGQRFDSLQALGEATTLAHELNLDESAVLDLRNETVGCLALFDMQLVREWEDTGSHDEFVFDTRLENYAVVDSPVQIAVRRVSDDQELSALAIPENEGNGVAWGAGFSPNGELLASHMRVHVSPEFLVWDWQNENVIFRSPLSDNLPQACCFSPDSRFLVIGRPGGQVVVFELASGAEIARVETDAEPHAVSFSPDGHKLAVGSIQAGRVQIWELSTGTLLRSMPVPSGAWEVAWHPNGRLLAVSSNDFHVHIWDTATGREHGVLRGHRSLPMDLRFSDDGHALSTWDWGGTVRLWNPHCCQELFRIPGSHGWLSADGRWLMCHRDSLFELWQVKHGEVYRTLPTHTAAVSIPISQFNPCCISPDGCWLAVPGRRHGIGGVGLYNLNLGVPAAHFGLSGTEWVLFHPSGQALFTAGTIGLYRWPFRIDSDVLRIGPPEKLASGLRAAPAIDPQGEFLVCAAWNDGTAEVIPLDGQTPVRHLLHRGCASVAISPDSNWIATGTHNGRGVKVWNAATAELVKDLIPQAGSAFVEFSPVSGNLLTSPYDHPVRLWQAESWNSLRRIPRWGATPSVAISADGKLLAYQSPESHVELQDLETGRILLTLEAPDDLGVGYMKLTPEGGRLVVCNMAPNSLRTWDLRLVRQKLAERGLDWDAPPYPPAAADHYASMRVEVDLGEFAELSVQQ